MLSSSRRLRRAQEDRAAEVRKKVDFLDMSSGWSRSMSSGPEGEAAAGQRTRGAEERTDGCCCEDEGGRPGGQLSCRCRACAVLKRAGVGAEQWEEEEERSGGVAEP